MRERKLVTRVPERMHATGHVMAKRTQSRNTSGSAFASSGGSSEMVLMERLIGPIDPETKRVLRSRSMANLLRIGHCAPTVMQTILDVCAPGLARPEKEWLVKLTAGMPGGIGNTGYECGAVTSPLVLLGLCHGLGTMHQGLPLIFNKGRDFYRRFLSCNHSLLCSTIHNEDRFPRRCIRAIRHAPEHYAETVSADGIDVIPVQEREMYSRLYLHLTKMGFHCSHAVFEHMPQAVPISRELTDATSAFVGGTLFGGMTCSAFTAGVMTLGLFAGEIENSRLRVLRMIAVMMTGGNVLDNDLNKFNRIVSMGIRMSRWFRHEFGSTQCRDITQCDFSSNEGVSRYIESDCVAKCRTIAAKVAGKTGDMIEEIDAGRENPARRSAAGI
ncbi:MAG TPA: C-GCAxxG-C-C family protein [Nitrospirota bacterium]